MKIVLVSTFALSTNYSRDLSVSLQKIASPKDTIYLCGKSGESAADNNPPKIDPVWRSGWLFVFDIFSYVLSKKPQLVHLQQEFKLYGNILSNILFPWLVLLLRLTGVKVVITIHGVISPQILGAGFLESFNLPQNLLTKTLAHLYLFYVYYLTGLFSTSIIVLAPALKDI
ncbi:hypothetical protein HY385_00405, partial [Candidatus Daviesbacteria bacterium]|nr:hypothetical protein [Candidatus Daviesbacteria bacterium]